MTGQVWVTDTLGGHLYSDELSKQLRYEVRPLVKFRQFCDAKDATAEGYGKELRRGDLYHWDVVSKVKTRGRRLVETNTIPETNFTVRQGTLTIDEFGNSVPYSGKLDNLSLVPVKQIVEKQLKRDCKETFDCYAWEQFNRALLRVVPANGTATDALALTTNGTATATNNIAMRASHVKLVSDVMKERNIPPYMGDDYMSIARPSTYRAFKNDLETIHQYTQQGLGMIMNGEIGRYESFRFIEQTQIPAGGAADSATFDPFTDTKDPWDNGKSDWCFFFGEDTVAEALVIPEEIRGKVPTDYGRSKGVAWYSLNGFGLIHDGTGVHTVDARVIKWDSAA